MVTANVPFLNRGNQVRSDHVMQIVDVLLEQDSTVNFAVGWPAAGAVLATGVQGYFQVDFAGKILSATLIADQSGSIVVDVWRDTYANFPPTDADSITASAPPTLTAAQKSQDATLTGWTVAFNAGDWFGINIDSCATIQAITLALKVRRT